MPEVVQVIQESVDEITWLALGYLGKVHISVTLTTQAIGMF